MNSVHAESKSLLFPSEDPIQLQGPFHLQNSKFYSVNNELQWMNPSGFTANEFFFDYGVFFFFEEKIVF